MSTTTLPITQITADPRVQPRAKLDSALVAEYQKALASEAEFPPVVVFQEGNTYWLADGFHRHAAALEAELTTIRAEIRQGSMRDAILFAVSANTTHGLRRTNADKRRAVSLLLGDSEWSQWSDVEIAERAGVSDRFVASLRTKPSSNGSMIGPSRKVERAGKTYTMRTSLIGAKKQLDRAAVQEDDPHGTDDANEPFPLPARVGPAAPQSNIEAPSVARSEEKLVPDNNVERRLAALGAHEFGVIYADPPWGPESSGNLQSAPNPSYPTLTPSDLAELPVAKLSAASSVLFLWSTSAQLPDALWVMETWGFRYTSNLVWVKNEPGPGACFRDQHELLLLGVKGSLSVEEAVPSVLEAEVHGHAIKPVEVYDLIERMYPGAPGYLELFTGMSPRRGWTAWDLEAVLKGGEAASSAVEAPVSAS